MRFNAECPMGAMLDAARGTVRLHMPGHKGLIAPDDITELARTDDLYAPAGAIAVAEALAAHSCHAGATLMLTGGSTAGLLAMLLSHVAPGETLLLPRGTHHAALSACIWGDINAVFADDLCAGIRANPGAKAVLVTRPDYYGQCVDLAAVASAAHAQGMLVLVDEAHGAHFSWWDAPQSAALLGADAWVQSAHKTLPALTGAAWLHLADAAQAARARRFLRMVQTSSPPFPILRSLDTARAWMDLHGAAALSALVDTLAGVRARIAALEGYESIPVDDPTRLVIGARGRGYTGLAVQAALSADGIDVEMADDRCIVCICTVADTAAAFDRLLGALAALPPRPALPPSPWEGTPPGMRVLSVRQAALGPQTAVPLREATGRIAAAAAGMYPPGIPLVLPGEQVTGACAAKLSALPSDRRFGVEDGCLICVE